MELTEVHQIVEATRKEVLDFIIASGDDAEKFRIAFLGTKGKLKDLFSLMKEVPVSEKKQFGQILNDLKLLAENKLSEAQSQFSSTGKNKSQIEDYTLPGYPLFKGSLHPVTQVRSEILDIFLSMGYLIADGPEIEDDWHNFTALNFPPDHPARDMQDTYFLERPEGYLLRTHTSPVQVRTMQNQTPPIRVVCPGRVFRNETISARSHCFFHQIEGLYIDEGVSLADLKQTLLHFARSYFGEKTRIRLRPSYFPFTEPSAEVDIYWGLENEVDYRITKGTGWLEILGSGMVDPAVLQNCGIDPEKYSGFAFGLGIDRIALLKYRIPDIRLLTENDVRFLEQFG